MEIIKSIIIGLFTQSIIGFMAWTAWQIAATGLPILPSIPLTTGIALWILWFMMFYVPIFFAIFATKIPIVNLKPSATNKDQTT